MTTADWDPPEDLLDRASAGLGELRLRRLAELAVERVLHMDGNQSAGAVQILADFGVATLAAVCLGLQLPVDAPMVSGGLDRRMSRVRVLRI